MIFHNDGDTIRIFYSECNDGWMYDIYIGKQLNEDETDPSESDGGGMCTSDMAVDVLGMATTTY